MLDVRRSRDPERAQRPPISTTADALEIDPKRLQRGVFFRRVFTTLLFVFIGAAMFGVFGIRTNTVTARGDGMTAHLEYASINRRGVTSAFKLRVDRPAGFAQDVHARLTLDYFDIIGFRGMTPQPASEVTDATAVDWTFTRPKGTTFSFDIDGQLDSAVSPGRHRGVLTVYVGDGEPLPLHFTTFVLP